MSKSQKPLCESEAFSRESATASGSGRALSWALAISLLLHAGLLLWPSRTQHLPRQRASHPLEARLLPSPTPVASAPVLKNTLEAPRAEVLEDPIPPAPRRRITEKQSSKQARSAPREPPSAVHSPEPVRPPIATPETASPLRPPAGLDLRLPETERAERLSGSELRETLGRLSEEMLYPADALKRGLEGEVVILVELGEGGVIRDASVASGSGHSSLDEAAVRAVRKLGSLGPATAHRTVLLPVRFRIL